MKTVLITGASSGMGKETAMTLLGQAYTVYVAARQVERMKDLEKLGASPASVIANVMAKAIRARKPKTRYAAGNLAKPLMFVRKWFGDRMFDRAVMRAT